LRGTTARGRELRVWRAAAQRAVGLGPHSWEWALPR
jgi:hypothetical protein